jgi:capsular exopolysaccharide synthesis family protein
LADYYAALLRCVQSQRLGRDVQSFAVGVTSCEPGEGVSTIAVNLAIIAARSGARRVLLVDANKKSPSVAQKLKLVTTPGFTELLGGSALLGDAIQTTVIDGLSVLASGDCTKQLGSDYDVDDFTCRLDELKSEFDFVVFDLPQAAELSECYAYAEALDGIFLVMEALRVEARVARRVTQRLEHAGARLLGVIYNQQT